MSDNPRQSARDQRAADEANAKAEQTAAQDAAAQQAKAEPKPDDMGARHDTPPADPRANDGSTQANPRPDGTWAGQPDAPMTDADREEADRLKAEQQAAHEAEQQKAKRAADGVTGDASGNPAGVAFSQRIADAKFTLRNQGHTEIEALLDDMLAGMMRLEGKFADHA